MATDDDFWKKRIFGVYKSVEPKKKEARSEADIFMDVASRVAERYPEYVVIVRSKDGCRAWKFSDTSWALGACQRLAAHIETEDFKSAMEAEDGNG
jgi:hypothetical protein